MDSEATHYCFSPHFFINSRSNSQRLLFVELAFSCGLFILTFPALASCYTGQGAAFHFSAPLQSKRGSRNENNDNDKVPKGGKTARMRKSSIRNKTDMSIKSEIRQKSYFLGSLTHRFGLICLRVDIRQLHVCINFFKVNLVSLPNWNWLQFTKKPSNISVIHTNIIKVMFVWVYNKVKPALGWEDAYTRWALINTCGSWGCLKLLAKSLSSSGAIFRKLSLTSEHCCCFSLNWLFCSLQFISCLAGGHNSNVSRPHRHSPLQISCSQSHADPLRTRFCCNAVSFSSTYCYVCRLQARHSPLAVC